MGFWNRPKRLLPDNWYIRYGSLLLKEYVNFMWDTWPGWHRARAVCINTYTHWQRYQWSIFDESSGIYDNTSHTTGEPIDADGILCLGWCYHFYNKSAILYTTFGGDRTKGWRINEKTWPVSDWIHTAYKVWTQECTSHERMDGRFVLAPFMLPEEDDKIIAKCIGLGTEPEDPLENIIDGLIKWHTKLCDLVQARATRPPTPKEEASSEYYSMGDANAAVLRSSSLAPTCRAILLLGRDPMPESMNVLLVLTGQNRDMRAGPPTFDDIPKADISSRRRENIIELPLDAAIRYLRLLERREEAANDDFRAKNAARRDMIREGHVEQSRVELFKLKEKSGPGFPSIALDPGYMSLAWDRILETEQYLELLESTQPMRQAI